MICKIIKTISIAPAVKYAVTKGRILDSNVMSAITLGGRIQPDIEGIIKEMEFVRNLNNLVKKPYSHIILSTKKEEVLTDEQWQEASLKLLTQLGYNNNQYLTVIHNDTAHNHVHILANRVNLEKKVTPTWRDRYKAQVIVREIEKDFGLERVPCSWEKTSEKTHSSSNELNKAKRTGETPIREKLQDAIDSSINQGLGTMDDFVSRLSLLGIETIIRVTRNNVEQGISFKLNGIAFQGNKLGKGYSLGSIKQRLEKQLTSLKEQQELVLESSLIDSDKSDGQSDNRSCKEQLYLHNSPLQSVAYLPEEQLDNGSSLVIGDKSTFSSECQNYIEDVINLKDVVDDSAEEAEREAIEDELFDEEELYYEDDYDWEQYYTEQKELDRD